MKESHVDQQRATPNIAIAIQKEKTIRGSDDLFKEKEQY